MAASAYLNSNPVGSVSPTCSWSLLTGEVPDRPLCDSPSRFVSAPPWWVRFDRDHPAVIAPERLIGEPGRAFDHAACNHRPGQMHLADLTDRAL